MYGDKDTDIVCLFEAQDNKKSNSHLIMPPLVIVSRFVCRFRKERKRT